MSRRLSTPCAGNSILPPINWRALFSQNKTNEFAVEVNLVADLSPINPFDFLLDPGVEKYPFQYCPTLQAISILI